jgi:hypothetical protein
VGDFVGFIGDCFWALLALGGLGSVALWDLPSPYIKGARTWLPLSWGKILLLIIFVQLGWLIGCNSPVFGNGQATLFL